MYNITFQQIESFLSVARYQNLSKTAEAMYISQPALSKTLQRFEEGVGLQLFYRSNQGVRLTAEGEYLYSTLEPLYNNIDKTIQAAHQISQSPPKTLRVVEPSTYDVAEDFGVVKEHFRRFEEKHPDVVIVESLGDLVELRRALEYGDTHLVVAQLFALLFMEDISYKIVSEFRLFLAMSKNHPLAVYDEPQIEMLSNEVFYRVPALGEEEDRRVTMERCRRMGFVPKRIEFVPNFATLLHKITTQRGVSICGKFTYAGSAESVKYVPLEGYDDTSSVVVAWRTQHLSKEAKAFVDMIPGEVVKNPFAPESAPESTPESTPTPDSSL